MAPEREEMAITPIEFLKLASSLIAEFDGKAENLKSFLDFLNLVNFLKESHEALAVNLIKTKLKGHARNLIDNENSTSEIIEKLKNKVKGESVDVISAKLLNIQQRQKTVNQYVQEVEKLVNALEGAYINDGMSTELATQYSKTHAAKATTKNCTIDKIKLIMEAGIFNTLNKIRKQLYGCNRPIEHGPVLQ